MSYATNPKLSILTRLFTKTGLGVSIGVMVFSAISGSIIVHAVSCSSSSDCQAQIDSLSYQNGQARQSVSNLQAQASSYQDAINQLQSQINSLQTQIYTNQAQQADLQQKINANVALIAQKKTSLGEDIKSMYVDGTPSTIEMLATSNNLSDYFDKQEYRTTVQNQLQVVLKQIATLQQQLQAQKIQVEALLAGMKIQQGSLANAQDQQNQLLNYNESQQAQFNQQISSNKSQIEALQAAQFAYYRAHFGNGIVYGGTGGYPYPNAVRGSGTYTWLINGYEFDPAGWSYRNCTSYAFWRLNQARGISLPAGDFPNVLKSGGRIGYSIPDFRNLGYRVDNDPAGASLAIEGAGGANGYGPGSYGHIMYIEKGSYVSQYNALGDGLFSTGPIPTGAGFWYVHIQ